jgi:hypothetical protein
MTWRSLDAQREACEAYIKSQAAEGWRVLPKRYDDAAYSGGSLDRPALQRLLKDLGNGQVERRRRGWGCRAVPHHRPAPHHRVQRPPVARTG